MILVRSELRWDKEAFGRLTRLMYEAASELQNSDQLPTDIAEGFWLIDTWLREWTRHENFPRPSEPYYSEALELVHDLAYFLFMQESPYEDDTLRRKAYA